jgi:hypothetical protein
VTPPPFDLDVQDVPRPTTVADLGHALDAIERTLAEGEARHRGAWRRQRVVEHVQHARDHLRAWGRGIPGEDHLGHALTRLAMAVQLASAATAERDARL